jgi:hypothetical protein
MEKFDEVSTALKNSGSMPWRTDGKHCLDRYKLRLASFKRADRARASASGAEKEFNEKDQNYLILLSLPTTWMNAAA